MHLLPSSHCENGRSTLLHAFSLSLAPLRMPLVPRLQPGGGHDLTDRPLVDAAPLAGPRAAWCPSLSSPHAPRSTTSTSPERKSAKQIRNFGKSLDGDDWECATSGAEGFEWSDDHDFWRRFACGTTSFVPTGPERQPYQEPQRSSGFLNLKEPSATALQVG